MDTNKLFTRKKINQNQLQKIFGGTEHSTGAYWTCNGKTVHEDTWYDNDDDGEISPGDQICHFCSKPKNDKKSN